MGKTKKPGILFRRGWEDYFGDPFGGA